MGDEIYLIGFSRGAWRKQSCPRHLQFPLHTYCGVSPYIAFSWPWAKARAGGISILSPMISM